VQTLEEVEMSARERVEIENERLKRQVKKYQKKVE